MSNSTGSDVNISIISGALDSVPKIVQTKNDNKAMSFTLAVVRTIVNTEGPKTFNSWYNIGSFNASVIETVEKLNKGDKVLVQGQLSVRSWLDQASGQKRIRYEIVAEKITCFNETDASSDSSGSAGYSNATETDVPDEIFS